VSRLLVFEGEFNQLQWLSLLARVAEKQGIQERLCDSSLPARAGFSTVVPAHIQAKIHQLCTEALAANTEADVERIIPELRAALQEHVRLAKASLEGQVSAIAALDTFKAPAV
jgi:hypothetical protein